VPAARDDTLSLAVFPGGRAGQNFPRSLPDRLQDSCEPRVHLAWCSNNPKEIENK
jgi:hypothetical protein